MRAAICVLLAGVLCGAQDLHFKTRTITQAAAGQSNEAAVHRIVQYDHTPGPAEIESLLKEGMVVVAALPDNAVVVAAPGGVLRGASAAHWSGRFDPDDKLSPDLPPDATFALVEFHADVSPEGQDAVLRAARIGRQHAPALQPNHTLVTGRYSALRRLAQFDEVAYIFPADPELAAEDTSALLSCAGMLTTNGPVAQYATIVHGWNLDTDGFAHLTYLFGSITPRVPSLLAQSELLRALNEWAKVTNLTFQHGPNPAGARNILIKFASGSHGDAYPFDGPKNALAHTFYPVPVNAETIAGDMHLDADEKWQAGGDPDIYSVALHEAGHAIGLGHSDKPGDVMYPYYRSRAVLSAGDIRAARTLYGEPKTSPPAPVTQPETSPTSPLRLTVDTVPVTTRADRISASGTISGGVDPVTVQWQTGGGSAGRATGSRAWSVPAIPLVPGENTITISAYDAESGSASASVSVTRTLASSGSAALPVSIRILAPSSNVSSASAATLSLAGTAAGAITRITWQTSAGAGGTAAGTANWVAAGVPLLRGTNTIIVRAWDDKGSSAWASVVVTRR